MIVVENEHLMKYLISINPPTYQYSRYIDWIVPYLEKEFAKNLKQNIQQDLNSKEE